MSFAALLGGVALSILFRARLNATERAPFIGRLKGRRTFEAVLGAIVLAARALLRWFRTKRLQVQMRLIIVVALVDGQLPFLRYGYRPGSAPAPLNDPGFKWR